MTTYTDINGIRLMATGADSGTWGTNTNVNLQMLDAATKGVKAISLSGTTHTLTTTDGALSDANYAVLVFGGSPSGTNTVTISPNDQSKLFVVKNNSGQSVVMTQGSGGNATILNGNSAVVYADGNGGAAQVVEVSATFGDYLTVSNNLSDLASASTARTNLGLGTIATQASNSVTITGGSISGITDLAVADGGTGASTASDARTNLGVVIGTDVQAYDADLTSWAAITRASGFDTFTATPSSANLAALLTDETGNGAAVFATSPSIDSPTLTTPVLGTPSSGDLSNCTGTPTLDLSNSTVDGTNEIGFRNVPAVGTKTTSYTLATGDVGKYVQVGTGGSITIPDATFSEGDVVSIFNNTSGDITITCSITTAYIAGNNLDKASVTLATRGTATILFISGTVCVMSGNIS